MRQILKAFFAALLDAIRDWQRERERDALIVDKERAEAKGRAAEAGLEQLERMADAPDVVDADDARRRMRERPPGTR